MEQDHEWPSRVTADIGRRVEHYRRRAGMTVQALADRCATLNLQMDRSVIAKLEKGLRQGISVGELIVLGKALGVPPVLLVFPLGSEPEMEILPGQMLDTWKALLWFVGEDAFPVKDDDGYWFSWQDDLDAWKAGARPLSDFRIHAEYVIEWQNVIRKSEAHRRIAESTTNPNERDANLQWAEQGDTRSSQIEKGLLRLREDMRRRNVAPPKLDPLLAHLEPS